MNRKLNGDKRIHTERQQTKQTNGTTIDTSYSIKASHFGNPEDYYKTVISQLTRHSLSLVDEQKTGKRHLDASHTPQDRILDEKQSWKFVAVLHKCTEIHLLNSSNYHQFFVAAKEYTQWMKNDIMRDAQYLGEAQDIEEFDEQTLVPLFENTTELCNTLAHWRTKLLDLKMKGELLLPINKRLTICKESRIVRCIHDFRDGKRFVREDEELVLLDNSNEKQWKVRSEHDDEFFVPSPFLVILGNVAEAQSEVIRLNETYGELWTALRGLSRKILMKLVCSLIRECDKFEDKSWSSMPREKLEKVFAIVNLLESMFGSMCPSLQSDMNAKFQRLKELLTQNLKSDQEPSVDEEMIRCLFVDRSDVVEDFLKLFQESWSDKKKFWPVKKVNVLQAVESFEEDERFEAVHAIDEIYQLRRAKVTTQTSELSTSEQEEKETFVVTGVINPQNKQVVSLIDALSLGIVKPKEGKYIGGPDSSQHIPIPQAMNENFIKVGSTKKQVYEEKRSDIGFITIKSIIETRPYTIKFVVDPCSGLHVTLEEAVQNKILNQRKNIYRDTERKINMSFEEALEKNLLIVDFGDDVQKEDYSNEADSITYAVTSVLDTRTGQWESFKQAVNIGLLNPDEGTFFDRSSNEQIKLADALRKKLIKATTVADPSEFDFLPNGVH